MMDSNTHFTVFDPEPRLDISSLPPQLALALTTEPPGECVPPGPRMNPWLNTGAHPVAVAGRLHDLFTGLWSRGEFHRQYDGTVTAIPRRPVPSAGGSYGVHTHLVVGKTGLDNLKPGRYVYEHEGSQLLHRCNDSEQYDGWPKETVDFDGTALVFTVQPGRAFGRYRHRAWPLWIADAAYAWHAVEFLLAQEPVVQLGPGAALRHLLGVPAAASTELWLRCGLVPEIPLVSLILPPGWTVNPTHRQALISRQSPRVDTFLPKTHRHRRAVEIATLSGQAWVREADRIETWTVPMDSPVEQIAAELWRAHRAAAMLCYAAALSGRWLVRPVSGIPASDDRWFVHALAMIDARDLATNEGVVK